MKPGLRRQAGEHGSNAFENEVVAKSFYYAGIGVCALFFVLVVWLVPATTRLDPRWSVSAAGALLFAISAVAFVRSMLQGRNLIKGILGERLTADALESLRSLGYEVFHDVPDETPNGDPCNIDHVVIGAGGIFAIETKFRLEAFNGAAITVYADRIEIGSTPMRPDPRGQAWAAAKSLQRLLHPNLGDAAAVKAVVVFPRRKGGGGVDNGFKGDVWVLTPDALVSTLKKQRPSLTDMQARAACAAISGIARRDLDLAAP